MRYSASRDRNEREICRALEAIPGQLVTVQPIMGGKAYKGSRLGNAGTPDLIVGHGGKTFLVEVKNLANRGAAASDYITEAERGEDSPARYVLARLRVWFGDRFAAVMRKTRRVQLEWWTEWAGSEVHVVTTAQEAAAVLGLCLTCGDAPVPTTGLCADCQAELSGVS